MSDAGEIVDEFAVPPDVDGLAGLVRKVGPQAPQAVIESMTGARFVHDRLEELGWDVRIADAARVKGIGSLAAKTDKIDARVLAILSQRDLVPEIWLPNLDIRQERELARFRLHLVKHRSMLKHRVHATLVSFGKPCPVTDLFGVAGLPGHGPLRGRRPPHARRPQCARAMALDARSQRAGDRRARGADRPVQQAAARDASRSQVRREVDERAWDRLGARLHDRRRDRGHDPDRTAYNRNHIAAARQAIQDGVDLRGLFLWALMDTYEFKLGYSTKFGLIRVDYATQERTIEDSGRWYRDKIARNGLDTGR